MNAFTIRTYLWAAHAVQTSSRAVTNRLSRTEQGQASAEYALVLLGAAAVALIFGKWATGNDTLKKVFSTLLERIMSGMDSVRY